MEETEDEDDDGDNVQEGIEDADKKTSKVLET